MKAHRALPILSGLHTVKPNTAEASVWTDSSFDSRQKSDVVITERDCRRLTTQLKERGVRRVALSAGPSGLFIDGDGISGWIESVDSPGPVVSVTGAGDAATAALAWASLEGHPFDVAARFALAASALTVSTWEAVNPEIRPEKLCEMIGSGK
jgi:pseudouridine kinase